MEIGERPFQVLIYDYQSFYMLYTVSQWEHQMNRALSICVIFYFIYFFFQEKLEVESY